MLPVTRLWLITTILLGSVILLSETLTASGVSIVLSQFALAIAAFGSLLLIMRRWWRKTVSARVESLSRILSEIPGMETIPNSGEPLLLGGDEISKLAPLIQRVCSELKARGEAGHNSGHTIVPALLWRGLNGNLGLAADHVESIKALLEVSQTHHQPLPHAAFQNLEMVSKHLRETQRQLEDASTSGHLEGALQLK